ncbi:MAG: hypothetical protein ABJA20_11740 [Novosphingobium sp.]
MSDKSPNRLNEARATFNLDSAPGGNSAAPSGDAKSYRAKVFKSGNSLALRLPAALGLEAGMEMELMALQGGGYSLKLADAPKRKIDISKFVGKAPWLKPLTDEERAFDHSPRVWDDPNWQGWKDDGR